jgi:hypothetical protein
VGILLVISAGVHGYLAFETLWLVHTGTLAWGILLVMMVVALLGKKFRIPPRWIMVHRILALFFVAAILLHVFARNIL